jgi:hypothetical protein
MQNLATYFNYGPMKELCKYMATQNLMTQAIAIDGSNAENIQSTGAGSAILAGQPITIAEDAELDISADTETQDNCVNAVGTTIADDYEQWFLVTAKGAAGTLSMWQAGAAAAIGGNAVLKVPAFDPETYVAVAVVLVANDSAADLVIGTNALTGDATFHQCLGPVFPHPDNLLRYSA